MNKITEKMIEVHYRIGDSFDDAKKADNGFRTAGIRLRRQMKKAIKTCKEIRKLVIEVRKEIEEENKNGY